MALAGHLESILIVSGELIPLGYVELSSQGPIHLTIFVT